MAKSYSSGLITGLLIGAASALLIAGKKHNVSSDIALGVDSLKDKIVDLGSGVVEVVGDKIEDAKTKLTGLRATDDDNVEELIVEVEEDGEDALAATVDGAEKVADEIVDDAKGV